jgi:hypothetical protein
MMRSLLVSTMSLVIFPCRWAMLRRSTMWSTFHVMRWLSKNSCCSISRSKTVMNCREYSQCSKSNEDNGWALKSSTDWISFHLYDTDFTSIDFFLLFATPSALPFALFIWLSSCLGTLTSLRHLAFSDWFRASCSHWCWSTSLNWHNWCNWLCLNNHRSLIKSLWCFFINSDLLMLFQSWVRLIFNIHFP